MRLINNDDYVKPLKCKNLALIKRVYDALNLDSNNAYQQDVYLFETIHGHIVTFRKKEGRYFNWATQSGARMDNESLKLYASLIDCVRWVEPGHYETSIGLKRCK